METETRKFEVGDVWLCDDSMIGLKESTIQKLKKDFIKVDGDWESIQDWNARAKIKIRKVGWFKRLLIKLAYE